MAIRGNKEEFVNKARLIHGNKYDYSLVDYINSTIKIKIVCKIHGEFKQTPNSHLRNHGCPNCATNNKLTREEFVNKAKLIHGNKYDYSLVDYKGSNIKITIICNNGHEFYQTPNSHLNGFGCLQCKIDKSKLTINEFIDKAKLVHGNKYDYSLIDYKNVLTKIKIICPIHGEFEQVPNDHFNSGCLQCSIDKSKLTKEEFINKAKFIHNNKYDYSLIDYIDSKKKMKVICPIHG